MRYRIFVFVAFAAMTLIASCAKDNNTGEFKATAEEAVEKGKSVYDGTQILWSENDEISIYDANVLAARYRLSSGAGHSWGCFEKVSGSDLSTPPYTAVSPADIRWSRIEIKLPEFQHTPDGTLRNAPMYAMSNDHTMKFYHVCAVVRFRLSATTAKSVSRIAVATDKKTVGSTYIWDFGEDLNIDTPNDRNVCTMVCDMPQSIATPHDFYMYLPADTYTKFVIVITAADGSVCTKTATTDVVLERGKITNITLSNLTFTTPRFATSSTTSVVFSPGNLQYIGTAATPYWKFADYQHEMIGRERQNKVGASYDRDLFGWGTSGWNNGNLLYQPYSLTASYSSPYSSENGYGYGPTNGTSYLNDLTGSCEQSDWGAHNAIRNGGNAAGQWRTLTNAEWTYVFNTRPGATIGGQSGVRFVKAVVNDVNGVVLFPDNYVHPAGVTAPSSVNNGSVYYNDNCYQKADWALMEGGGAIFLPAAGIRSNASVSSNGTMGYYWSSTHNETAYAYSMTFSQYNLSLGNVSERFCGFSVRLVRD